MRRLEKRRNDRNDAVADEDIAEKVITSENVGAAAEDIVSASTSVTETSQSIAEEALNDEEKICDNNEIENEAVEATLVDGAEKQADAVEKRRFWLCIHHGCIDNTTLEELECPCCGLECEVVEYDSEEEYEPP